MAIVLICSDPLPRCHVACYPSPRSGEGAGERVSLPASPMPVTRRRRRKHQAWKPQNPHPPQMLAPSIPRGLRPDTALAKFAGDDF